MVSVIGSFADRGTEHVYEGIDSAAARKACPAALWPIARRKLDQLNRVRALGDLAIPPGNHLERLKGRRTGQHSIRVNEQYRICFRWEDGYAEDIEITDCH
jgi:proteic killer suppression protein